MSCSDRTPPQLMPCRPTRSMFSSMYFTSIVIGPGFDMRATWLNVKQSNAALLMVDVEHYEFEARRQNAQRLLSQRICELAEAMVKNDIPQETRKPWSKAERYKKRFF